MSLIYIFYNDDINFSLLYIITNLIYVRLMQISTNLRSYGTFSAKRGIISRRQLVPLYDSGTARQARQKSWQWQTHVLIVHHVQCRQELSSDCETFTWEPKVFHQ